MACRLGYAGRVAVVAAMLLASPARASENVGPGSAPADESATEQASAAERAGTWYGWQVFLVDAVSVGAFFVSAKGNSMAGLIVGEVGYYTGGPIVRALHDDKGAWGSFARRLLLPLGGALIGAAVGGGFSHDSNCSGECFFPKGFAEALVGLGAGAAFAMSYDWVAAREPASAVRGESSRTWAPVIVATRQMKGVGIALRF